MDPVLNEGVQMANGVEVGILVGLGGMILATGLALSSTIANERQKAEVGRAEQSVRADAAPRRLIDQKSFTPGEQRLGPEQWATR